VANPFDRLEAVLDRWILAGRRRSRLFERVWLAQRRYFDVDAGRLAAATAYYGFFAIFAMVVSAFIILGRVFRSNSVLVAKVQTYLALNLPQLKADQLLDGSQNISILAFIGLVIAGVSWVEHLRSSQRALWKLQEHPGNPIVRWMVDFVVLIGLGILILVSIAVFSGVQELIFWLVGDFKQNPVRIALHATTPIISGLVDLVLGSALLMGVPRIRMPLHRLAPSALLFAVGLGLLKTLGRWYITRTEHNPAYQVVAGTVGLLLFMYLFHQLLLFSAALAAVDQHGRVIDLAGGQVKEDLTALTASAERAATLVEEAAEATERAAQAAACPPTPPVTPDRPAAYPPVSPDSAPQELSDRP
jgi:membrane protein